mgnify:FL=1
MVYLTQLLSTSFDAIKDTLSRWGLNWVGGIDFEFSSKVNFISKAIMGMFAWLGNYGWTIILFTLFLRLLTLPLDFWQKFSMKKNSKIMGEISEIMEKIDKAYANNPQSANAEKQKVMKKYGYKPFGMCLPTIVTMAVFIFMYTSLSNCGSALNIKTYQKMQETYLTAYCQVIDRYKDAPTSVSDGQGGYYTPMYYAEHKGEAWFAALSQQDKETLQAEYDRISAEAERYAKQQTVIKYETDREGFLWIKSIWRSDGWQKALPENYSGFTGALSGNKNTDGLTAPDLYANIYDALSNPEKYFDAQNPTEAAELAKAQKALGYGKNKWNGLLILPVLAVALSFVTTLIGNKSQGNLGTGQQAQNAKSQQKMMMFIMPIMMGVFALTNSAAFALYLVASSVFSILFNLIETPIIDKMVSKRAGVVKKDVGYRR